MRVASYYVQRGAWVAAAQRSKLTIEQYDGAPAVRLALETLVRAYHQLGYAELEANAQKVYVENFGDEKPQSDDKRWWKFWQRG